MRIGFHLPLRGWHDLITHALSLQCQCLQIFSHNPRSWSGFRRIILTEVFEFQRELKKAGISPLIIHSSYLVNLASPQFGEKSIRLLLKELEWGEKVGAEYLVFHPGSGEEEIFLKNLKLLLQNYTGKIKILIENTSGGGRKLGGQLEEIERWLKHLPDPRLGFALDTAHAFQQGYEISSSQGMKIFLKKIEEKIGKKLLLLHLNDSLSPCGSHRDRHWHIGEGRIGKESLSTLLKLLMHKDLPVIMETPGIGTEKDFQNLRKIKQILKEISLDRQEK